MNIINMYEYDYLENEWYDYFARNHVTIQELHNPSKILH